MGRAGCRSRAASVLGVLAALTVGLGAGSAVEVGDDAAPTFTISATVDKAAVRTDEPLTLTLTLSGDLRGVELPRFTFPDAFTVTARSQGTSLSVRGGVVERAMTLTYVLVAQRAGRFSLGPFTVEHGAAPVSTEPLTITVEPSSLAPSETPPGGRVTL